MTVVLDPKQDGITHINVYSKAKTSLGLFLSNFTEIELETDEGDFKSVEAYWYYLSCPKDHPQVEELKNLSGYPAKKLGREIRGKDYDADKDSSFQEKIKKVLRYKIENSTLRKEFAKSTLPFTHYYVYEGKASEPTEGKWQIEFFEELRQELKSQLPLLER
ncbi:MAG TPA: hypothetical protein VM577_19020 [Anaerovoracaceae bacterium]|nr:hypothetical protein [Anaerovoracaceae bacterium]